MRNTSPIPRSAVSIAKHLATNSGTSIHIDSSGIKPDSEINMETLSNREKVARAFIECWSKIIINNFPGTNTNTLEQLRSHVGPMIGRRLSDKETIRVLGIMKTMQCLHM